MATHALRYGEQTLHGSFSRDYEPVLTVDSGDTVAFTTLCAGWILDLDEGGQPLSTQPRRRDGDSGHALCGPVAVRGAEPGMTLAVTVETLRTGSWGWTAAGGFPSYVNDGLGLRQADRLRVRWDLDPDRGVARMRSGYSVRMAPFMGVMGMPPAEPGVHSTTPPRPVGGNIDCRELTEGSTLYLPIAVPGALFSTGDGHAAQGDGEVSGTAIECPMERAELVLSLSDEHLAMPYAQTPKGLLTFGFDRDLNKATITALDGMLQLMGRRFGLKRSDALVLASVAVDLRVTQVANDVNGVHALLPVGAIDGLF